jgi:peptidyl-prolyl cis-trans isomerase D
VFEPDVLSGSQLRTVELAPGRVVAIKVVAHEVPREKPLDEVRAEVIAALEADMARQAAAKRADQLLGELRNGASWTAVAGDWVPATAAEPASATLHFVHRSEATVPTEITAAVFKAGNPAGKPIYGTTALGTGDTAVWTVTFVKPGAPDKLSPAERAQVAREAREKSAMQDVTVYIAELRAKAEVQVNPALFE